MPDTFTLIQSATVGAGGAASIDFNSIPATFTDLCVLVSTRSLAAGELDDGITLRFNGSTSGYSRRRLTGSGSSVSSDSGSSEAYYYFAGFMPAASATSSTFGNNLIYVPNYVGSNNKSISSDAVTENNATAAIAMLQAGLWSNSAAITSISLASQRGSNFAQHSTAYLYGIVKQ